MGKMKDALMEYGYCAECDGHGFTKNDKDESIRCAWCGGIGLGRTRQA
jgi:DNA-directed RNA polymerase subunit RPC12/RpoP